MSEDENQVRGIRNRTGSIKDLKGMLPKPKKPASLEDMENAVLDEAAARHAALNEQQETFNPVAHDFVLLQSFDPAPGVQFYEYRNHSAVNGTHDLYRLNYYLSQDGDFVNVWYGCPDPMAYDVLSQKIGEEVPDFEERMFRGYIETAIQGEHIIKALRLSENSPQVLRTAEEKLVCEHLK